MANIFQRGSNALLGLVQDLIHRHQQASQQQVKNAAQGRKDVGQFINSAGKAALGTVLAPTYTSPADKPGDYQKDLQRSKQDPKLVAAQNYARQQEIINQNNIGPNPTTTNKVGAFAGGVATRFNPTLIGFSSAGNIQNAETNMQRAGAIGDAAINAALLGYGNYLKTAEASLPGAASTLGSQLKNIVRPANLARNAAIGGTFGASNSLMSGSTNPLRVAADTAKGAVGGVVVGSALESVGPVLGAVGNKLQELEPKVFPEDGHPIRFGNNGMSTATAEYRAPTLPIHPEDRARMMEYVDKSRLGPGTVNFTKGSKVIGSVTPQLSEDAMRIAEHYNLKPNGSQGLADVFEQALGNVSQVNSKLHPQMEVSSPLKPVNPDTLSYNTERMGISPEAKAQVQSTIESLAPKINEVTGKPLTFKEVQQGAKMATELSSTMTREDAAKIGAQSLALRQKVADLAKMGATDDQYKEALIKDKAFGQYIARLLGQRNIVSDPAQKSIFNEMVGKILKTGVDPDTLYKEAKSVNFADTAQATDFYRKYVKATPGDWLDLLRYNSMLSSPATHLANIGSNFQGTGIIAPIEKTITGAVDFLGSKLSNRPQQQFAGEGAAYASGYYSNVKNAAQRFSNVLRGADLSTNPDIRNVPLASKGLASTVEKGLSVPMKLLEGMDQFFSALTEGGSESAQKYRASKGVNVGDIQANAGTEAAYRLFRGDVGAAGQNPILGAFDSVTKSIESLRNSPNPLVKTISKFTIPFLKTPTNILKQGVEYSPFGLATVPGSGNPQEQIAKSILGASVAAGAATLLGSNRLSWAEPVNATQKAAFRAAGMQPYSVKVGDKWYSYTKMHPVIAMNLALISAIDDAQKQRKLSESDSDTLLNGFAKVMNFYADASYAKNIGDFVSGIKGGTDGFSKLVSNYPSQLIPYRALLSYINRAVDPVQRQADPDASQFTQTLQNIMAQIPGLSQKVPARVGSNGQPIENQNRLANAVLPVTGIGRVTTENPAQKQAYDTMQALSQVRRDQATTSVDYKQRIQQYAKTGDKTLIQGIPIDKIRTELKSIKKDQKIKVLSPQEAVLQGATQAERKQLEQKGYQAQNRPIDPTALLTGASKAKAAAPYNSIEDKSAASAQFSQDLSRLKAQSKPDPNQIIGTYKNRIDDLSKYLNTLDPKIDQAEYTRTETAIEKATQDVQKYASYGGFKKPPKGKKTVKVVKSTATGSKSAKAQSSATQVKTTAKKLTPIKVLSASKLKVAAPKIRVTAPKAASIKKPTSQAIKFSVPSLPKGTSAKRSPKRVRVLK